MFIENNFILPDMPLHFHLETLLRTSEIKGDLTENKCVGDCIISRPPGMSFTNLILICFTSFIYLFLPSKEIKFNKGINLNLYFLVFTFHKSHTHTENTQVKP